MKSKGVIQKVGLIITVACLSVMTVGGDGSLTNKAQAQETIDPAGNGGCPDGYSPAEAYTGIRNGQYFTVCPNPAVATDTCCRPSS
jgi:hypothetical protein